MICMIDEFLFDLNSSENISKKISLSFAKNTRLGNSVHHQAVGNYDESFSFEASFYNKKRDFLENFETKIKEKKPLLMIFGDGIGYEIVVNEIELVKSYFDTNGSPLKQTIKLTIEVYYG